MFLDNKNLLNRIIKYTPAVTNVDECTNAETGVGAAIGIGNHIENGICALLAAIINKTITITLHSRLNIKFHLPLTTIKPIDINSPTSPIRLHKTVTMPELKEL